ncbi:glycosyltransferase family 4 protein [Accumulibacter sp.]|uniref:glycosyltransferase family 4 protein n=1 Tax=Accumulibacter sp. TaxID=2053492 RepID=UPI002620E1CE|nr:glycosyltransferase family 4 protein [Accumulibacter sp.]
MRIGLIADTFPPLRTSGAVQLRDLVREFVRQGHSLTVLLPADGLNQSWELEYFSGARVLRLRSPRIKNVGYVRRTIGEFVMPFAMFLSFLRSPLANEEFDGLVWYSPSIFHGPLVARLKRRSACKAYLIIRDLFPEWAVDLGLMRRGAAYQFFRAVANYQYAVADVIGVQTPGNLKYFESWVGVPGRQTEVLQNWLGEAAGRRCRIRVEETALALRRIFVYAGNMGIAQGMDVLLELAERFRSREDVGFLFVGRGSEAGRLAVQARLRGLDNVLFREEIDPDEIPDLYSQCHVGLVALDARHRSHNIPGKFLTYMQSGLPVLASVNRGNDLAAMIRTENVGRVCEEDGAEKLQMAAEELLDALVADPDYAQRCRSLFFREFSAERAVRQIVGALAATTGWN